MQQSDVTAIVEACFHGEPASCSFDCPFGLDIRAFMDKAAKGKWNMAYKSLRNAVVFPVIVSRLCPAPCKAGCQRAELGDEPLDLPLIERAVIDYTKKKSAERYVIPPKSQSVAVVGAGVSGLTCALGLAQKQYLVTVFDKSAGWGGLLRGHKDFELFDEDFTLQFGAVNVTWEFSREIENLDELSSFDAAYIATGGGGDDFGLLDSYNPDLYTTAEPRVFMGGGLTGAELTESIAAGTAAARHIEAFLQSGRVDAAVRAKIDCSRRVTHNGVESAPRIVPESGESYTEEEAMREASRCMLCDCAACMTDCEMLDRFRKKPKKTANEVYTDSQTKSTFSSRAITRQTYSCNMCRHCESVCPEGINMGELFAMSRRDRFEKGAAPYALHDFWLRETDFHNGEASFAQSHKTAAARNLDTTGAERVKTPVGGHVFYPGCQLGAHNPEHVLKTYAYLREKFDCGVYLGCCGAPAFWAGDGARLNANLESIRETARTLGDPAFIFACATCEAMFSEYLPEIKRVSLYKLLADDERLRPAAVFSDACVFDPCSARGDEVMMESVRAIAKSAGTNLTELLERNRCCGYGGLVRGGNPRMYDEVSAARANMSDSPYIVYCANCRGVLSSRGKDCVHILDMALGLPVNAEIPKISERRRNSLRVKSELMKELKNEVYEPEAQPWDSVKLVIEKELAEEIDRKLISEDDMKETIWLAESSGDKFFDEADGSVIACLIRRALTYWVRYKPLPGGEYEIRGAYYHRMRFDTREASYGN